VREVKRRKFANMKVWVKGPDGLERAIKKFKSTVTKDGTMKQLKIRNDNPKPSRRRKAKAIEATRRKKTAASRLMRKSR
jgi:small subunit ribosomal protein S21